MADKFLEVIDGYSDKAFVTFLAQAQNWGGQSRGLNELYRCFAPFELLVRNHYNLRTAQVHIRPTDESIEHLTLTGRNPILIGLSILRRIAYGENVDWERDTFPSWHGRRSITRHGATYNTVPPAITVGDMTGGWSLAPSDVTPLVVPTTYFRDQGGVWRHHISFDDYKAFCRTFKSLAIGQTMIRSQNSGLVNARCTLDSISISADLVQVVLTNCLFESYPSKSFYCPKLYLFVSRHTRGDVKIAVSGYENSVVNSNKSLGRPPFFLSDVSRHLRRGAVDPEPWRIGALRAFDMKISDFRPGLYHTQCQAMSKVLLDISKNFENFVESPELLELLRSLESVDHPILGKILQGPILQRIKSFAALISGLILLYSFALRPAVEAVQKLAKGFVVPLRGEGEMVIEGELATLPSTLAAILTRGLSVIGLTSANVRYVRVSMRSTVTSAPTYNDLANATLQSNPALLAGVLPSPEQIWNVQAFSFVVDWFVPIGRLIADHTAYFRSPSLDYRIGHTVRIEFEFNNGQHADIFLRSMESNYMFDPPSGSWLSPSGVPWVSIPLAIAMLLGR